MGPVPADVAQGVVLDGRYRIDVVIGQGGMATVYRARDTALDRDVAVKLFPPTPDSDEVLRHQAEISVLAHMSHPGLVALHDAGSAFAGGPVPQTYIVMELVPGPTLADLLTTGPLTASHTARIGRQLAEAIAAVHDADVVHRDIKPANILLVDRGAAAREAPDAALTTGPIVKLADFGIARFADGARLTMTGTTLGTATYLSPEQATGSEIGPPTDVYALALVLLECLTGRKAFTGTVAEVAAARLHRAPHIPDDVDPAWRELLTRMVAREPADRPTMAEVARGLAPLATGDEGPTAVLTNPAATSARDDVADRTAAAPVVVPSVRPAPTVDRTAALPVAGEPGWDQPVGPADADRTDGRPAVAIGGDDARRAQGGTRTSAAVSDTREAPLEGLRPRRRATVLPVVVGAVVALGLLLLGLRTAEPESPPPPYPTVPGPLGEAIDELARSVAP